MPLTDHSKLSSKVRDALRATFSDLLAANPDRSFYAFAIWTDDSLQFFSAAANTEEGLANTVEHYRNEVDPKYGSVSTLNSMRWSYGDWEFFPIERDEHLSEINGILGENFNSEEEVFLANLETLWQSLLDGFLALNDEGFFGTGGLRSKVALMVVGHVPEDICVQWINTLNPPEVAQRCLRWDCDAPDDETP